MNEQKIYAAWLDTGTRVGFMLLVGTFIVYASGFAAPHVPFADLPKYWGLPVDAYLAATNAPTGWDWLALAAQGDYMNFIGVAFLGSITMACYARILPVLLDEEDYLYATVAIAELGILATSASGLIGVGH
jgi:hypothetical protein